MAKTVDLRTYVLLERAFIRRLQRTWAKESAPTYAAIAAACNAQKYDEARRLVSDLDMAEVGTQNREWITYMLLSCAVFGAGIVAKGKPSFVGVGTFDTLLKQTTQNFLQYLEFSATQQVQQQALQLIAKDEAKTEEALVQKWGRGNPWHAKSGLFTSKDKASRAASGHLHSAGDAIESILNDEHASIDRHDVRSFLEKALEEHAHENVDLTHLHVEGMQIFGGGLDIDRADMPQIPRVHRQQFLDELDEAGIEVVSESVDPLSLKPTQNEIGAQSVAEKLRDYDKGKKKFPPLLISKEGRVLDGHHHWAMMATFAIDHPEAKVPIFRLQINVKKALAFMHAYDKKHGIERKALGRKAEGNPYHDKQGLFTSKFTQVGAGTTKSGIQYTVLQKSSRPSDFRAVRDDTGELIAEIVVKARENDDGSLTIRDSVSAARMEDVYRRQGIGTVMYAAIEKTLGITLKPSDEQTAAAEAFWTKRKVQKSNPYHDEEGQFTSKEKAHWQHERLEVSEINLEQMIPKNVMEGLVMFHGTASSALAAIKKDGLVPKAGKGADEWSRTVGEHRVFEIGDRPGSVFMAESSEVAIRYSRYARRVNPGSETVLLAIKVPKGVVLHPDERESGSKIHRGPIPPEWIRRVTEEGELVRLAEGKTIYAVLLVSESVQKADATGRYVTRFVSFDQLGNAQLQLIASLNASRLATWGFTAEAEVLGMARYRITAVLDGRTSPFCRMVDGKIFQVADAREKVIECLNVQDPNDLKVVQPWPKQTTAAIAEYQQMSASELTERGLHIPPYHPSCRTLLKPIESSKGQLKEVTPAIPAGAEVFQTVTASDLKELGVNATQEQVDQWNQHVGMSPVELLSKLAQKTPQDVLLHGVGPKPIQFQPSGNLAFSVQGMSQDVSFKLGTILDPFTGTYYLSHAQLLEGTPAKETQFLKKMFRGIIDMGLQSTATSVAVGVAGNAAYYAKLGFLPDPIDWGTIRKFAWTELTTGSLQPVLASLAPEDQLLVQHLLQDRSVSALSALVDLPFVYQGKTIGEWILMQTTGTWGLDLTDDLVVAQAQAYLS